MEKKTFNRNLNDSLFFYITRKSKLHQNNIPYENGLNKWERGHGRKAQWEREQSEQEVNLETVWPLVSFLCTLKEDPNVAGVQMAALDRRITSAISLQPWLNLNILHQLYTLLPIDCSQKPPVRFLLTSDLSN